MNQFTAIGTHKNKSTLYVVSDKVNSGLMDDVLRIVYRDVTYVICEGHVKCINGAVPEQLLSAAKERLTSYLKDEDAYTFYAEARIRMLREYIEIAESTK
jgi:hypothetical protein